MTDRTVNERVARYRTRLKQKGVVRVCVYVPKERVGEIKALAEKIRREEMAGWQPIETAPVGEPVMLFCAERPKHRFHVGVFRHMGKSAGRIVAFCHAPSYRGDSIGGATHWMPLPEPPA